MLKFIHVTHFIHVKHFILFGYTKKSQDKIYFVLFGYKAMFGMFD